MGFSAVIYLCVDEQNKECAMMQDVANCGIFVFNLFLIISRFFSGVWPFAFMLVLSPEFIKQGLIKIK